MSTKTNTIERNGHSKSVKPSSVLSRALTKSEWPDKVSNLLFPHDELYAELKPIEFYIYASLLYLFYVIRMNFSMLFTGPDKSSAL